MQSNGIESQRRGSDAADGREKWSSPEKNTRVAVAGRGRLLAVSGTVLTCIALSDGKTAWRKDLAEWIDPKSRMLYRNIAIKPLP